MGRGDPERTGGETMAKGRKRLGEAMGSEGGE